MTEPVPRLKSDWVGRKVRVLEDLENQRGDVFPRGVVMEVVRSFGGLWLEALFFCQSCYSGRKRSISKTRESRVELLPVGYEETVEERMARAGGWAAGQLGVTAVALSVSEERAAVAEKRLADAVAVLTEGLKYHEHDGYTIPKRVCRDALKALGVAADDQP